MRAVGFRHTQGDLIELDRPIPVPGPGEVVIRTSHAGVNFAEVQHWRGDFGVPDADGDIPGLEAAGQIHAVGADITELSVGDQVTAYLPGFGGYAEYVAAPAQFTFPIGDLEPLVAAGAPTVLITAYGLLAGVGRIAQGDTVLIHGAAGGVGTVAAQLARALGAGKILGTVGSPAKVDYARPFGYDQVLLRERFASQVRELTEGRGVDLVLEPIGGAVRQESLELLAPFGRLAAFGDASGEPDLTLELRPLWKNNRLAGGFNIGDLARRSPELVRSFGQAALELVASGQVRIDVTEVLPLADAKVALNRLADGANLGKLVLTTT
jgi:NADPH2:quinone reductase